MTRSSTAGVEQVLGLLEIPGDGDWQERLRATAHRFRRIALDHPNVVSLLVTRPLATPLGLRPLGTLRPLEQILDLLQEAGFAPTDALFVYRAYYGALLGHSDSMRRVSSWSGTPSSRESRFARTSSTSASRTALHALPRTRTARSVGTCENSRMPRL